MWKKIVNFYNTNATFHGFVAAAEGGLFMGLTMAMANGIDFSKKGLIAFGTAVGSATLIAIRNWFKNRPGQPAIPGAPTP